MRAEPGKKPGRRGCVGLCKSADLHHWECCEPLYAPHASMSAYECPDMFYENGWWYLIFSQFTDRFQTIYRMSRSCHGPWKRPKTDSFDGRAFYAAKKLRGWKPPVSVRLESDKDTEHLEFRPGSEPRGIRLQNI